MILCNRVNQTPQSAELSQPAETPQTAETFHQNPNALLPALNQLETHETDLASIPEKEFDSALSMEIDDISVNPRPQVDDIKELIHYKRINRSGSAPRRKFLSCQNQRGKLLLNFSSEGRPRLENESPYRELPLQKEKQKRT